MADYFTEREKIEAEYAATNTVIADYISRQAAIDALCKVGCDSGHCGVSCDDVMAIEHLPSVDVQPVRHGHWTETTEPCGWTDEDCAECSECHNTFVLGEYTIGDVRELFRYCPNCGARMDEGSSNV